mmetsp:Transcript_20559/g.55382  ORF Transcript_20559/g.55382 Transcript_20559/m.55382 type:complete len:574 (+) Transcript_20559:85-1806(+)
MRVAGQPPAIAIGLACVAGLAVPVLIAGPRRLRNALRAARQRLEDGGARAIPAALAAAWLRCSEHTDECESPLDAYFAQRAAREVLKLVPSTAHGITVVDVCPGLGACLTSCLSHSRVSRAIGCRPSQHECDDIAEAARHAHADRRLEMHAIDGTSVDSIVGKGRVHAALALCLGGGGGDALTGSTAAHDATRRRRSSKSGGVRFSSHTHFRATMPGIELFHPWYLYIQSLSRALAPGCPLLVSLGPRLLVTSPDNNCPLQGKGEELEGHGGHLEGGPSLADVRAVLEDEGFEVLEGTQRWLATEGAVELATGAPGSLAQQDSPGVATKSPLAMASVATAALEAVVAMDVLVAVRRTHTCRRRSDRCAASPVSATAQQRRAACANGAPCADEALCGEADAAHVGRSSPSCIAAPGLDACAPAVAITAPWLFEHAAHCPAEAGAAAALHASQLCAHGCASSAAGAPCMDACLESAACAAKRSLCAAPLDYRELPPAPAAEYGSAVAAAGASEEDGLTQPLHRDTGELSPHHAWEDEHSPSHASATEACVEPAWTTLSPSLAEPPAICALNVHAH